MTRCFNYIRWRPKSLAGGHLALLGLCLSIISLGPNVAMARLSGEAEFGYVSYNADVDGAKSIEGSSFKQRYSLIYATTGTMANGRLGKYKFSLGYEWLAFDSKITTYTGTSTIENNPSLDSGQILYRGEVTLDPKEFPIRLKMYSRDLNRGIFLTDNTYLKSSTLINPGIATSLLDATTISSGFNAEIGLKDSMAYGYSGIFAQLPRILVDYQDYINKDRKSFTPTDTRLRKLAFISINKKDNWFHIRSTDFTDYLNTSLNYKESQVILGTIDQSMQRRWVDFSNWIKLSANGGWTKHNELGANSETYDINLFGIASRSRWEARTFNSFRRVYDGQGFTYETKLPVYVSGVLGTDTDWRVRVSTERIRTNFAINPYDTTDTLGSYRIDTFKRERFTLAHSASIQSYQRSDSGKTLSLTGRLESGSTRRFSSTYGLYGSYEITSSHNQPLHSGAGTALTQYITLKGVYNPLPNLRTEVAETVTISSGNSAADLTTTSYNGTSNVLGYGITTATTTPTDSYIRYRTTAKADWEPFNRLKLGMSIINDTLQIRNQEGERLTELANTVSYSTKSFRMRFNSRYILSSTATNDVTNLATDGTITYTPDRSLEASLQYSYSDLLQNEAKSTLSSLRQNTSYYIYSQTGVSRRILELSQGLEYIEQTYSSNVRQKSKSLTGGIRYYPLSRLFLAANVRYTLLSDEETVQNIYNGTIGFNFNLLQAAIDYSYGRQNGNGNRLEKRLEANVKKTF